MTPPVGIDPVRVLIAVVYHKMTMSLVPTPATPILWVPKVWVATLRTVTGSTNLHHLLRLMKVALIVTVDGLLPAALNEDMTSNVLMRSEAVPADSYILLPVWDPPLDESTTDLADIPPVLDWLD